MRLPLLLAPLVLLSNLALAQSPTLAPRAAVPAPAGLTLVPGDSITVVHNGVATTTLLPSLGAFLSTAAPLASNTTAGLMRGDGNTITVDPTTGTASVVGQAPTEAATVPSLSGLNVLLADGTYLTGPVLQALLGVSTPTLTPTPTTIASDGTLSGLPSTIVAGQPLSSASYVPTTGTAPYLVLYNVGAAAEEGSRFTPNVMPGGNLSLLIPQTAHAYTVRGFAAATGGSATYGSAPFNVTAAPGALPAAPTQAADTGATSSSVTMSWSATAPNYLVLGRAGVGSAYGSLVDTTVSNNSYTFTGLAASSSPRAVIIPQNANGYGTPSAQFLSFTTAQASTTPTYTAGAHYLSASASGTGTATTPGTAAMTPNTFLDLRVSVNTPSYAAPAALRFWLRSGIKRMGFI